MVACLNAIGVTHVTFGNHEDDIPRAALVARVDELHATWLATNVHGFARALPEHDVIEVGGIRVGLLGVVLVDPLIYRRPPFGATLEDPRIAALREVAHLTGELGCAWVVALTHQSADDDRALARALHGAPVIVLGGHEHVPLDEDIGGIRVLKAGTDASHAVVVDAVWTTPGAPQVTARRVAVEDYPEDAEVRALVERALAPVRALATATLVEVGANTALSSVGMRVRQTSVGELVCTRLRDVLDADACVFNAGGIRAARDYPERFTYGDLEAEVPFDNEVVVIALPGSVLRDAIVSSRARAPLEDGGFLQVDDGIRFDATGAITHVAHAPFDPARLYRVATIRDLCFGLDHIEPLIAYTRAVPTAVPPPGGFRTPRELLVRAFAMSLWDQLGGFAALDANHDGRVSPGEVTAALGVARHGDTSELLGEMVVHAFDVDRDDAVEPGEAPDGSSRSQ
jgi:2',3'-cyclic-nucleotide 2'-phosphodiesterase (5'-nucleotidase family)